MADAAEEAYIPDNAPYQVKTPPDGLCAVGPVDPQLKIQRGFEVHV